MKRRNLQYIEQVQHTECGICCVAMLLNYYGYNVDINEMRATSDVGREGSTIFQVKELLVKYQTTVKVYKTVYEGLFEFNNPVILLWEDCHYVVLKKITNKKAIVIDPEYGTLTYSRSEFEELFSNYVINCIPNEIPQHKETVLKLWSYVTPILKQYKWKYLFLLICAMMTYICSIGIPILIQNLIDGMGQKNIYDNIVPFVLFMIAYVFFEFGQNIQTIKLQADIDENINKSIFEKILRLPYKFFDIRNHSDILISMNSGMAIRDLLIRQLINGFIEIGAAIVICIYMIQENTLFAIISIIVFSILLFVMFVMQMELKDKGMSLVVSQRKLQEVQTETIFSILNVKMLSLEEKIKADWNELFGKYKKNFVKRELLGSYLNICVFIIINVLPVVLLILGLVKCINQEMTLGSVMAFYSLSGTFFSLCGSICAMFIAIVNSELYFGRLKDILSQDEVPYGKNIELSNLSGKIIVRNVSYKYSKNSDYVLKNVSVSISSGEKVAIVGKSGSGKSTLVKLLIGLYNATEGSILFDDININDIKKESLYNQIGVVPQDVMLFNKSIYENISVNRENISLNQVVETCKLVDIDKEIQSMPMNYNTVISDMGMNLSGGQRQRIALCRALVGNPSVIVMDEATSALDNIHEKTISDRLKTMKITRLVVAHRLSTVYDADKIIVLDNGEIVGVGTHEELLETSEVYQQIASSQLSEAELKNNRKGAM